MAFRSENQKMLLNLDQIENLLQLPDGLEVVGLDVRRDPPLLSVLIYNPHIDPADTFLQSEVPVVIREDQL